MVFDFFTTATLRLMLVDVDHVAHKITTSEGVRREADILAKAIRREAERRDALFKNLDQLEVSEYNKPPVDG
jgi:hypothetical protein